MDCCLICGKQVPPLSIHSPWSASQFIKTCSRQAGIAKGFLLPVGSDAKTSFPSTNASTTFFWSSIWTTQENHPEFSCRISGGRSILVMTPVTVVTGNEGDHKPPLIELYLSNMTYRSYQELMSHPKSGEGAFNYVVTALSKVLAVL